MILMKGVLSFTLLLMIGMQAFPAQSTTYYISPAGSDTNPGTEARPWLSFSHAINPSRATCGDTLILRDGTYGDGTSTGKILVNALVCTQAAPFTIRAENQRRAKIFDNGTGRAVQVVSSAFIVLDGLYARSTDTSGSTQGYPFFTNRNTDITLKNLVGRNPNRYANTHVFAIENSSRVLIEDSEGYVWHRHCVEAWKSRKVVSRRVYCNPRGGRIAGGFGLDQGPVGTGGAVMSMYPCQDCIQENNILDGTTNGAFLNEMNATFGGSIMMANSKVLGSICYKCNFGNGIYINSRNTNGLNNTPQDITIQDVAFIDHDTYGMAVRVSDGVNIVLDHLTGLSDPSVGKVQIGISTDDNPRKGTLAADNSITVTNTLMAGYVSFGFKVTGFDTWTVDRAISYQNGTLFYPPSNPSSPTQTLSKPVTSAHNMGTCKVWVPDGAAGKGKGTGGSDIGANILYRYINGILTTTPLWDPRTGEFPHGAEDVDGTNRLAGESLFDIHKRLNVNTGGCSFPENYGGGDSDTKGPDAPVLRVS